MEIQEIKCNSCKFKDNCDSYKVLIKYQKLKLNSIVNRHCNQYKRG